MRDISSFFASSSATTHSLNHYALIDAAQVPELHKNILLVERLQGISLFSLTQEHGITEYGPILVQIQDVKNEGINASLTRAMRNGWTVTWLNTTLSLMELALHLAHHMNGRLSDGREILVRYYDPRVLPIFLESMEQNISDGLMAPIAQWAWWDRQMLFTVRHGGGIHIVSDLIEINVSKQMQEIFSESAREDLIYSMLLEHAENDEFSSWLPHVLYLAVKRNVAAARKIGLISLANIYLYVSIALRTHPSFFSRLSLKSQNSNVLNSEIDLPQLILRVKDDDWDMLSDDGKHELENLRQAITNDICLDYEQSRGR